jgi:hypothetical protein
MAIFKLLVVIGSKQYALQGATLRPACRPPGVWPPAGHNGLLSIGNVN